MFLIIIIFGFSENNQSSTTLSSSLQTTHNQSSKSAESTISPLSRQLNNCQSCSTPINAQIGSRCTTESDVETAQTCEQPLYANAPPKPRRWNDEFSSPSPDLLDRYGKVNYIEPIYETRSVTKSPNIYDHHSQIYRNIQADYCQHCQHRPNENRNIMFTPERRTPDTYGRSQLHPGEYQRHIDYEDVYDEQSRYKRPLSPVAYSHVIKRTNNPPTVTPVYRAYTPVDMTGPNDHLHFKPSQMRKRPITRPHSADFLEYEMNRQPNFLAVKQQPRPKSSLDINKNIGDTDNYFYSEEQYANKMRQTAQYLQKIPSKVPTPHNEINTKLAPIRRYQENENTFPLMRSSTQPINFNTLRLSEAPLECQPMRSRSVLSEGSLSKELDMNMEPHYLDPSAEYAPREIYGSTNTRSREFDPFTRSASARLAQNSPHALDENYIIGEGERKVIKISTLLFISSLSSSFLSFFVLSFFCFPSSFLFFPSFNFFHFLYFIDAIKVINSFFNLTGR